jgi:y4mF family transcriptional regulator
MLIQDSAELGALIRKIRKQQKVTQLDVAAAANVGIRFIRELETGKRSCQMDKVFDVLQVLGLKVVVDEGYRMNAMLFQASMSEIPPSSSEYLS